MTTDSGTTRTLELIVKWRPSASQLVSGGNLACAVPHVGSSSIVLCLSGAGWAKQ
jgi:hypothetical protein